MLFQLYTFNLQRWFLLLSFIKLYTLSIHLYCTFDSRSNRVCYALPWNRLYSPFILNVPPIHAYIKRIQPLIFILFGNIYWEDIVNHLNQDTCSMTACTTDRQFAGEIKQYLENHQDVFSPALVDDRQTCNCQTTSTYELSDYCSATTSFTPDGCLSEAEPTTATTTVCPRIRITSTLWQADTCLLYTSPSPRD